jgi:hypothetical protein
MQLPRRSCLDRFLYSNALLTALEGDERPVLVLNVTDLKHGTAAASSSSWTRAYMDRLFSIVRYVLPAQAATW